MFLIKGEKMTSEQTVLIALFDILGFSNKLYNNSFREVFNIYTQLLENTIKRNEIWSFDLVPIDEMRVPAILRLKVESVVFSDSVIAWVPMKQGFANPFIKWCCDFICEGLSMELPIRGAISAGDVILDKDKGFYLGKPIVEAHNLEKNQDWIGMAFSHQATWPPLIADISPRLLMEYQIPIKKGNITPISPDWPRVWRTYHGECPSKKLRSIAEKQDEQFRKYYLNAAIFAEHSEKHADWFNEEPSENEILRMKPYDEVRKEIIAMEAKRK